MLTSGPDTSGRMSISVSGERDLWGFVIFNIHTSTIENIVAFPRLQGTGTRLLLAAEDAMRKHGCTVVQLSATKEAEGFYRKRGYAKTFFSFSGWYKWL